MVVDNECGVMPAAHCGYFSAGINQLAGGGVFPSQLDPPASAFEGFAGTIDNG